MKSDLPKVLHEIFGRPMLAYVLDACRGAGCDRLIVVIGHQAGHVRETFADSDGDIEWVEQTEQLGTGHAVMVCGEQLARLEGPVLVLAGDGPLIRSATLRKLLETHQQTKAACTLATSILDDPGRYGRIVRDEGGNLAGIVEYLDATDRQREIKEVNVSLYCFDAQALRQAIAHLDKANTKGEYYLTDTLAVLGKAGKTLSAVPAVPADDVLSINTQQQLSQVEQIMTRRANCGESR